MNRYLSWCILMVMLVLPLPAFAGPIGYSGASWGELRNEGGYGANNTIFYGWIDQGIDWTEIKSMRFSTYVVLRYSLDTQALDYNNYLAPGIGAALRKGPFKLGLEYYPQHYLKSGETDNKIVLFVNWWVGWDLKNH